MNKISCDLCLDLMPLVRDGIAAEDSRQAVEAHIENCESCRSIWQGSDAPMPHTDVILEKTSRRLRLLWGFLLMLCTIIGLELTNGSGVFYNTLVMPAAGILGYLFFGKRAVINVPVLLLITHFVTNTFHFAAGDDHLRIFDVLFYTVIYSLIALLGVGLAALVHGAFRRESAKRTRILNAVGALCILLCFGINAASLVGNPVSKMLAAHSAEKYAAEHHPDYDVTDVSYNFKTGGYNAYLAKPNSTDAAFSISFDALGHFLYSDYEWEVFEHFSTYRRLDDSYRQFGLSLLKSPLMPLPSDTVGCSLRMASYEEDGTLAAGTKGIDYRHDLETDGIYDIMQLAEQYGEISLFLDDTDISVEHAAEMLLTMRDFCDRSGLPFAYLSLSLQSVRGEDGNRTSSDFVFIDSFPYAELYEENLVPRLCAFIEEAERNLPEK